MTMQPSVRTTCQSLPVRLRIDAAQDRVDPKVGPLMLTRVPHLSMLDSSSDPGQKERKDTTIKTLLEDRS